MISKITMNGIASYKQETSFEPGKKNLIYGLNGTGKTMVSAFLRLLGQQTAIEQSVYSGCSVEGYNNQKIMVYNQEFVAENFYKPPTQKGIFTLAKGNKEAKEKIDAATTAKDYLNASLNDTESGLIKNKIDKEEEIQQNIEDTQNKVWKIKTDHIDGDRDKVFDKAKFLDGYKNSKANLFRDLLEVRLPTQKLKAINDIRTEVLELGEDATAREHIEKISTDITAQIENNNIFREIIIGSKNNTVSGLINELKNSNWIKEGLGYVDIEKRSNCPFCQQETITKELVEEITGYFDKTYQEKIDKLKELERSYEDQKRSCNSSNYKKDYFNEEKILKIDNLFRQLHSILDSNLRQVEGKINNPSAAVTLQPSNQIIDDINVFIDGINNETKSYNDKLNNRINTIMQLKNDFWGIQRKDYDSIITNYEVTNTNLKNQLNAIEKNIESTEEKIGVQDQIIIENRKDITNIDEVIENINKHLLDFGIKDFEIAKTELDKDKDLYRIKREHETGDKPIFASLSEGEKTVISFLYFVELCKGTTTTTDTSNTRGKIIVIDDPISSLSHIYVFNLAELIKNNFSGQKANYSQCFVLTHNLYFFNELIDRRHGEEYQTLFRISKDDHSYIEEMDKTEIQNEYQAYWSIIKDTNSRNSVLVANAMRNIIEYFFGFVKQSQGLGDILGKQNFPDNKYQAFKRYMDRESHSDPTNLSDHKEIDYNVFMDAFKKVFIDAGYEEHYDTYMGKK